MCDQGIVCLLLPVDQTKIMKFSLWLAGMFFCGDQIMGKPTNACWLYPPKCLAVRDRKPSGAWVLTNNRLMLF